VATETKIALKQFEGAYLVETSNGYLVDNRGLINEYKPKNNVKLQEATNHFNRVVKLIKQSRYAKGGTIEVGDSVHIPSFNKSGVVVKKNKHKPRFVYIVKFVDNSTAPYIREDLEKIEEFGNGGGLDGIANNNFENKLWDNLQTRSMGFEKGATIKGKKMARSVEIDKRYKAYKKGRHKSSTHSVIEMANGKKWYRKNANQYGDAYGGRTYTENRPNRTDRGGVERPKSQGGSINKKRKPIKDIPVKKAWEYTIGGL
jgi:hypothetical protein